MRSNALESRAFLGQVPLAKPFGSFEGAFLNQEVGNEDGDLVAIDRTVADGAKLAVDLLDEAGVEDPAIAFADCWRTLRVRKWKEVTDLRNRLASFLDSTNEDLLLTPPEYELLEEVLTCAGEMVRSKREETAESIGRVGVVVGILGGVAALLALTLG